MRKIIFNISNRNLYKMLIMLVLCIISIVFVGCKMSANKISTGINTQKRTNLVAGSVILDYSSREKLYIIEGPVILDYSSREKLYIIEYPIIKKN